MKAKEYLPLVVILAACVVAALLPFIASGSLEQTFNDPDLVIPNTAKNLLPSILGLKWPPAPSAAPAPALHNTPTASPPAATPTTISISATTSTFSLNFTPVVTPTPYPSVPPKSTKSSRERPTDSPSQAPSPTDAMPTYPPPTSVPPTHPPPTNPPPTSVPPTDLPPASQPPTDPPSVPSLIPPIIRTLIPLPRP